MARKKEAYEVKEKPKKQSEKLTELISKAAVIKAQLSTLKASEVEAVKEIKAAMQAEGINEFNNGEFVAKLSETATFDKPSLLNYVKGLPTKISKSILTEVVDEKLLEEAIYRGEVNPIDLEPFQVKGSTLRIVKAKIEKPKGKKK